MIRAHEDDREKATGVPASPSWTPGTQFSSYEIESLLATGGMAEVWRAKMKGLAGFEKRVVIKTMLTSLQHRPELVEMFVSEASLAARLSHPNIVDVFDFGQLEGRYFIAMSYVPGLTLRSVHRRMLVRAQRLPVAAALHIVKDVCEALQHVHELEDGSGTLGLVHRDLSPDNIIISSSGTAKLIDFGAARATARTPPNQLFVGRFRYAAPERVRHEGEDCRSDVYSAGVVLYECLTGVRPFNGSDAEVVTGGDGGPGPRPAREGSVPARERRRAGEEGDRPRPARAIRQRAPARRRDCPLAAADRRLQQGARGHRRAVGAARRRGRRDAGAPTSRRSRRPSTRRAAADSDGVLAVSEKEMLEASGPIRRTDVPGYVPDADTERISLPLPPEAFRPRPPVAAAVPTPAPETAANLTDAVRIAAAHGPERNPLERAVELFDLGIALRAQHRYIEALDAWQQALTLAPGEPRLPGQRSAPARPARRLARASCRGVSRASSRAPSSRSTCLW